MLLCHYESFGNLDWSEKSPGGIQQIKAVLKKIREFTGKILYWKLWLETQNNFFTDPLRMAACFHKQIAVLVNS